MAAGVVAFVGFVGLSVDAVRGYLVQSRLAGALDAAGLAGARVMFSPGRDQDIVDFFNANFPSGYLGATVSGPQIAEDAKKEVLTLTAQATIDTSFMRVLGFNSLTVSALSEVTRQTELLEMVVAVDMSGSMSWDSPSRISSARAAANTMVDILFGDDETKSLLKIGVVPWSGKVNVTLDGSTLDTGLTTTVAVPTFTNPVTGATQSDIYFANNSPVPLLSPPPSNWRGCVFARYIHDGTANDADLTVGPTTAPIGGKDWPAWEVVGPEGEPVPGSARCDMSFSNKECTSCLTHGVTPLQNTKTAIKDAIDALVSPTGSTDLPQGLAWGWRVLVNDAPFTEASATPDGDRTRAIVLLTDGENTGWVGDGYKTQFGLGTAAQDGGQDQRLLDVAAAIKAQGILIYVVQFANTSGDLSDLLKQVASGEDAPFYHAAPTAEELQQVFREVANDLSQLRVSK